MKWLAVISALLVATAIAMSWRSHYCTDLLGIPLSDHWVFIADSHGGALYAGLYVNAHNARGHRPRWIETTREFSGSHDTIAHDAADYTISLAGIGYAHVPERAPPTGNVFGFRTTAQPPIHRVRLPWWLIALLVSPPFLSAVYRRRRRSIRRADGLCLACGYDLRSTPDRCPECGVAAVQSAA